VNHKTTVAEELARLVERRPTLQEILQASPYDANKNMGGLLTDDIFFDHLFVQSPSFSELSSRLRSALESNLENIRVLLLDGFSGTGKTTFVKQFIKLDQGFDHFYVDFHSFARNVEPESEEAKARKSVERALAIVDGPLSVETSSLPNGRLKSDVVKLRRILHEIDYPINPITIIIKGYISKTDPNTLLECLYFVYSKIQSMAPYLSGKLLDSIAAIPRKELQAKSHQIINSCDFSDAFILFFLHCFRRLTSPSKAALIIFDNLDSINLDYLSEYFTKSFAQVISTITLFSQDPAVFEDAIDFSRRFKFIFCLRDGNSARLNAHIADSIGHTSQIINFKIRFDPDLYREIVIKRISFFSFVSGGTLPASNAKSDEAPERVMRILEGFSQDKYFQAVAVPLFNSDFRRLILALFDVAKSLADTVLPSKSDYHVITLDDFKYSDSYGQYGLRGCLLFGLIKYLKEDNFLQGYPFFRMKEEESGEEGYCLHTRMILTVLLNNSHIRKSSDILDSRSGPSPVSLSDLLRKVGPVYPVAEIITTLVESFKVHERNWVHLITFRNKNIMNANVFDKHLNDFHELGEDLPGDIDQRAFSGLEDITITLNPAGFVCLKHILPHFEFYSNLIGNQMPLFYLGIRPASTKKFTFLFQEYIDGVQKLTRRHIVSMTTFFQRKLQSELKWDSRRYKKSDFSFRHLGDGSPRNSGYFHSTRLLTSHIGYVDRFRLRTVQSMSMAGDQRAALVNNTLIVAIEKYIGMFDLSLEEDAGGFKDSFREKVKAIRSSDFRDVDTPVDLPGRPYR
jgi:hypothetical protein